MSGGDDRMPKIDVSKLKQADLNFMKLIEKQNLERVQKLKALRTRNLITLGCLGVGILSIYGYSMLAVRQESFLDDFEVPATTTEGTDN